MLRFPTRTCEMRLWSGRGHKRYLFLFVSFLVGFYVHNVFNGTITIQITANAAHCQTAQTPIDDHPYNDTWTSQPTKRLGVHTYLPNGLLRFNPNGPHPVLELIKSAEEKWQKKLDRASRTLEEAVREYRRRYKRAPPLGFDDWWDWSRENDVQLLDEYDTIWRDLEPFWGMAPRDLQRLHDMQEQKSDSFTIGKNETHDSQLVRFAFSDPKTAHQRALLRGLDEIVDLLLPVEDALPPYRAVFSPHDNPNLLSDYHVRKATIDAAAAGKYVDITKLPRVKHLGFASACGPGTPGRPVEYPINQHERPPPRTKRTFIHDHRLSMDPCRHPHIFYHHAQYVAHDLGPAPQSTMVPQFSYCSTPLYHDIQSPTFISWTEDVLPRENDPKWEDKSDERLLWRGSNTGMNHNDNTRWRHAQRMHLVSWASDLSGTSNILMPALDKASGSVGNGTEMKRALINPAMMDIAFSGKPVGCDPKYCDYLQTQFEWRKVQSPNGKEAGNHKYIIDVDGNGWSSRFKRLMTSNSLIFKATAYPEWWLDRSQPWVHYVPVQVDYSDLYDVYVFFRGGLYGEGNHDDLGRKIASAGREWSKSFWRKEDMTAYFFRLLLEYARVMSDDRDAMSYNG